MNIIALIPAHQEEAGILAAIDGLRAQTTPPDQIIVIADNCTDRTVEIALNAGVDVVETVGNTDKKAGALNQVLQGLLPTLNPDDVILVQDADSALDAGFIANALVPLADERYGAVGGVFRGDDRKGFVAHLQRNEYAKVPLRTQARIATFEHRKKIREHGAVIVSVPGGRLLLGRWGWRRV